MSEGSPVNLTQQNPLYSRLADIRLKKFDQFDTRLISELEANDEDLILLIRDLNPYCQFEKLEMVESVFEPFPKGSLIVRDTSDIITHIQNENYKVIYIKTLDGQVSLFEITSVSYLNNAASETEENFVAINFSNFVYFDSESNSLTSILLDKKPEVKPIDKFIPSIDESLLSLMYEYELNRTSNYCLYKPLNTTESRIGMSNDNFMNYFNYLATYAIPRKTTHSSFFYDLNQEIEITFDSQCPRFMLWSGWKFFIPSGNNISQYTRYRGKIYLKYFYQNIENDTVENNRVETYNLRYAVYDSDSPAINITINDKPTTYKKIYTLKTSPAKQISSTKYFYVRKTPKHLSATSGNTYQKLMYQFQDEGEKYDYDIITSEGLTAFVPVGSTELFDNLNWGYYDSYTSLDKTSDATHIGHDFGYGTRYTHLNFGGGTGTNVLDTNYLKMTGVMPYIDCAEMWKNQFDLTTIDPHLGLYPLSEEEEARLSIYTSYLQKVIDIRYQVFKENLGGNKQLEHIRKIEKQNFISYVLCCLKDQKEESFFAALLGYSTADGRPYFDQRGVNDEPLKYRYSWAKLKLIDDPTAIKLYAYPSEHDWKYSDAYVDWAAPENRLWALDIGTPSIIDGKPNGEWSGFPLGDLRSNYAINLNERTNWYNAIGLTFSGNTLYPFPGQGTTGAQGGYYAPGWHAQSVLDEGFEKIKYRPIGHDIGDLVGTNPSSTPTTLTYPPMYDAEGITLPPYTAGACNYVEFKKRHIVKMYKTPIIKLLLESNITDQNLLEFFDGKFIYWFTAENIMDGPCD